jgi:crotonobetainyl-CoA:carnitine CoA-transferase CaiB-like acyl-CoA transferase
MEILTGVRVLDVGRFIAIPYCGWLLACLGAEVIRVESSRGEFDRYTGLMTPAGQNVMFLSMVSGKKSVTLNLTRGDSAKELLAKLVAKSDVVLENLGLGTAAKWGLTYEDLCQIKPDIILVHSTAYGSEGPYKDRVGFDPIAQAMSGAMSLTGTVDTPMRAMVPYVDYGTALHAVIGVVTALLHRSKTGKGQKIDVSLLRTALTFATTFTEEYRATGRIREPRRIGNRAYWFVFSDLCWTKDGKGILISAIGPLVRRLLRAMGREDLISDPRFATDLEGFENRDILDPIIKEWVASKTRDEIEEIAAECAIPVGPVLDYTEVPDHPQVKAEKLLVEARLSDGSFEMAVPACPIRFSEGVTRDNVIIPRLGEHNEEIWGRLCGLSSQELARLKKEGII